MAHQAGAYPGFCSIKRLAIFLLPLDGMLVHRRVIPNIKLAGTHLYTWVERGTESSVLPKDTTQCPRPGLEPRLLDLELSTLIMRSIRPPGLYPSSCRLSRNTFTLASRYGNCDSESLSSGEIIVDPEQVSDCTLITHHIH